MSVVLNPSNFLGFHRPLTQLAKRSLTITNNNAQPIAFKVKTTAPKLYCVRPNSGRVEPGQSIDVSVMLQAMKEEPPPNAKCKDKFLIQSTLITPEKETMALQDIWSVPEGSDESSKVHQKKLKVMYLPPEGQPMVPEAHEEEPEGSSETPRPATNGLHHPTTSTGPQENGGHTEEEPAQQTTKPEPQRSLTPHNAYSEPSEHEEPTREIPIQHLPSQSHLPSSLTPAVSAFEAPPPDSIADSRLPPTEPEPQQVPLPIPPISSRVPSAQPPAPAPVFAPAPAPLLPEEDIAAHPLFQELVSQYHAAMDELERLRKETARSSHKGLSDAGSVISDTDVQDAVYQQDGVPLQIVVIIALAVFITTYLFL